jgi:hypothetical protein
MYQPSISGLSIFKAPPQASTCRRKIEKSPGAQSRDDTPLGADTTSAILDRSYEAGTGEAKAGSAEEQPAEE